MIVTKLDKIFSNIFTFLTTNEFEVGNRGPNHHSPAYTLGSNGFPYKARFRTMYQTNGRNNKQITGIKPINCNNKIGAR